MPSDPAKKYSKDGSISSTIRGKRMVASPLQNIKRLIIFNKLLAAAMKASSLLQVDMVEMKLEVTIHKDYLCYHLWDVYRI
jgi:hypothetical protein